MERSGATSAAIEALYRERFRPFLLSVTALLGDGEAALDVVQDGFALALSRRQSFRGEGSLEAWVWRDEEEEELRVVLLGLPERQRLAIFLRYYADLSYAQIAEVLGVAAGTVAASLNAAHRAVRRNLREEVRMSELRPVLDELVAEAQLDRADWSDVVGRSRGLQYRQRPRKRLVLVLALAVGAVLAGVGTAIAVGTDLLTQVERFHAELPDDPQRVGPTAEITSGEDWALIAWRSANGICLDFAVPGSAAFDCDFPVRGAKPLSNALGSGPPTHALAGFISFGGLVGGDSNASIFGVAAQDVAAIEIDLRDGRVLKPELYDAPPKLGAKLKFFIVRLPLSPPAPGSGSPVRFYKAYDRDGTMIERLRD